jgi:TolB-like protein
MGEPPPADPKPIDTARPDASGVSGPGTPFVSTAHIEPAAKPAEAAPVEKLSALWARVKERKVIQWGLAYLAAALALAHGTELLSHAFDWPHIVYRLVVIVLVLGLPVAATCAWYHGDKGNKHVSGAELAIISLLMLLGAGFLWVFVRPHTEQVIAPSPVATPVTSAVPGAASSPVPPLALGKPRIAIMPFENLSPDPANAFFTDGMQEEILTALANSAKGLEVISRTTMMSYKGKPVTVEQVAKDLACTHVLEGSVRREGNEVRLTLQLIDAKTDEHLWAQNYDRKLVSAITLQSEVAGEVASQLAVQLAPAAQTAAAPTKDPVAYDLYLKARLARENLNGVSPESAWRDVEALLTQAIARDPDFAHAYIERAGVYWWLDLVNYDTSGKTLDLARADVATARKLAPNDPALYAVEGQLALADQKFPQALKLFDAAEQAGLTDPDLLIWKATILPELGRLEEGLKLTERLAALDPGNPYLLVIRGFFLGQARRPADAIRLADVVLARTPDYIAARSGRAETVFAFAGDRTKQDELLNAYMSSPALLQGVADNGIILGALVTWLRLADRFEDIQQLIDKSQVESVRQNSILDSVAPIGLGRHPVAEFRGWADLLLGDREAAAKDGQAVLDFVPRQRATLWNKWYLKYLEADGYLLIGEKTRAIAAARESIKLASESAQRDHYMAAKYYAAWVMAWAGEQDEAASLLEELSTSIPGVPPAYIARDPIFTMPLANNARYQALKAKLEAQMAATKLE